jgi:hypothetical protein
VQPLRPPPCSIAEDAHDLPHDPGRSDLSRELRIGWAADPDDLASRFEHPQRFLERFSADGIEHQVVVMYDRFEVVALVVDNGVCTQALHPLHIFPARGRGNGRT